MSGRADRATVRRRWIRGGSSSRCDLVLKRWSELGWYGAVSAGLGLLGLYCFQDALCRFTEVPWWVVGLATIVPILLCVPVGRGRWLALLGLRHLLTYPPLWVAGLAGAGLVVLGAALLPGLGREPGCPFDQSILLGRVGCLLVAGPVLLCLGSCVYAYLLPARSLWLEAESEQTEEPERATGLGDLHQDFERLKQWLLDDNPITSSAADRFHHYPIARRMVRRLTWPEPPAQALVGAFGAGKTSVRLLVEEALQKHPQGRKKVRLVPVELWVYENAGAAVNGVLRALVKALSREVNVLALSGLSRSYVEAMSSAGGAWPVVALLAGGDSSPGETLRKIDDVTTAIGLRYVLWIEDLERFAGRAGQPETPEHTERLGPLRALLHQLDQLRAITVVTATTGLEPAFDLEKIARFVEHLEPLGAEEVARTVKCLRDGCRTRYGVIDPASPEARRELDELLPESYDLPRASGENGSGRGAIRTALPTLCPTPRVLKQALRSALEIWEALPGELDLDDLLVASVLRHGSPRAFACLDRFAGVLQRGDRDGKIRERLNGDLAQLGLEPPMKEAVDESINCLLKHSESSWDKPQALLGSRHVNYWVRFLAVPELRPEERDQWVLPILSKGDDEQLLSLLEDPERSKAILDFSRSIPTERLLGLLLPLVRRRSRESAASWPETPPEPPGLMSLALLWREHERKLQTEQAVELLKQALQEAVPTNLYLAVRIEHWFVDSWNHETQGRDSILEPPHQDECKQYFRNLLLETYEQRPDALADALRGAWGPTLLWACWGLDRVRQSRNLMTGQPFPGWQRLAATILDAARARPAELLPQIAWMVVEKVARDPGPFKEYVDQEFDQAKAENLFGSVDAVLEVFASHERSKWKGDLAVQAVFRAVDARARAPGP